MLDDRPEVPGRICQRSLDELAIAHIGCGVRRSSRHWYVIEPDKKVGSGDGKNDIRLQQEGETRSLSYI